MKAREYFILFVVVTAAALAALLAWTLIVKTQLQSAAASNSTLNSLSTLAGLIK